MSSFGASFRLPFRAEGGGVGNCPCPCSGVSRNPALWRTFLTDLSRVVESEYCSSPVMILSPVATEAGDDCNRLEGSTGGSGSSTFGEKWLAWVAISAATLSAKDRLFCTLGVAAAFRYGVFVIGGDPKSAKGPRVHRRLPGVELKTEYSSAKRGVHPPDGDSSERSWLGLGVSNTGLGKTVGVCLGVGG